VETRFEDGVYLEMHDHLHLRWRFWPYVQTDQKTDKNYTWHSHIPDVDLTEQFWCEPGLLPEAVEARYRLVDTVPQKYREAIGNDQVGAWYLLQMLGRCQMPDRVLELMRCNRGLALVAAAAMFRSAAGFIPPAVDIMMCMPQRIMLKLMGFPPTQSMVRLIRKFQPTSADAVQSFLGLRKFGARSREWDRFRHAPRIPSPAIELILQPNFRMRVTDGFLEELLSPGADLSVMDRLHRVKSLEHELACWTEDPFRSAADLIDYQAELEEDWREEMLDREHERLQREAAADAVERTYRTRAERRRRNDQGDMFPDFHSPEVGPPHPFPGNDWIEPLRTKEDFDLESRQQSHCVRSEFHKYRGKARYYYRILSPERATVSIYRRQNHWRIAQIRLKNNGKVRPETRDMVRAWMKEEWAKVCGASGE
jgi:hypothetical protein